jgi:hypothetical protein
MEFLRSTTVFCEHGWRCLANFRGTPSLDSFRVADKPPRIAASAEICYAL